MTYARTRLLAGSTAFAAVATALTGCGLLPGADAETRTVTVWLMKDSVSDGFLARFTEEFKKDHDSIELDIEIQEWTGIGDKVTAALRSDEAPDLIEVGNTQVAQYAEGDGLRDLSAESVGDLGSKDWLPGLADPGSINGRQFGIPWYAANRVVIYNKDLFKEAGITQPPATRDQWLTDTAALNSTDTQGIYLAGQDWYTLAGFVWDEGGELAEETGGDWQGALHTPAALKGMDFYQRLQALGSGPKNADEATPPQADVFAEGDVAQIVSIPGAAKLIEQRSPELKGKLGYFPIPGKSEARPGAVLAGGSDLIVPEKSDAQDAAIEVVKALAGEKWQTELSRAMSYVPNKTSLANVIEGQEGTAAMAAGAAQGRTPPNSPQWAAVEADNPIKTYMAQALTGDDPARAARAASGEITRMLAAR
ncbi:extracellular solute-binding protein [Streptomyces sp. H27-C3]|uniref:extracellular solute-binding protein n=1 Tax=Streptomyces sp. H27-C3 TaxID=3046305 RepID=UPI0024BAFA0A|nr:extracellular solute-binding protein [Streptomyces sp. H27-C3]MDJ0462435.1 extracellular solute-binding protein [Streptomyces sp. H27-C3]